MSVGVHPAREGVLGRITRVSEPFPHMTAAGALPAPLADAAARWLETRAPWRRCVGRSFDRFECNLAGVELHADVAGLVAPDVLRALRDRTAAALGVELGDVCSAVACRLVPGQGVGLCTDEPHGDRETHRLIIHVGTARLDGGGLLLFFGSDDPGDIACGFRPRHNAAVGFGISPVSFHSITDVVHGIRTALVYSFWERSRAACARARGLCVELGRPVARGGLAASPPLAPHARRGVTLAELIDVMVQGTMAASVVPHLVGTYEILRRWGCRDEVCLAGLMHCVYGTEAPARASVSAGGRARMARLIGRRAEALAHAYSRASRGSLHAALASGEPGRVVDCTSGLSLGLDARALAALAVLDAARDLEEQPLLTAGRAGDVLLSLRQPYLPADAQGELAAGTEPK